MGILMLNGNNYTGGVQPVYGEASGAIASFDDGGDNKPLKSLKVAINPVQASGTPSPSNPLPISGWTGANVYRTGANVWDEQWEGGTFNTTTGIDINATAGSQMRSKLINISGGASYYALCPGGWFIFYDANMNVITDNLPSGSKSGNSVNIQNTVFTAPPNACYTKFYLLATYGNTYKNDISINAPSSDIEYHAHDNNRVTVPITWSDAGEVFGGYIEFKDGERKAYKTWKRGQIKDLSWTYYSSSNVFRNQTIKNVNVMTEIYKTVPYVSWNLLNNYEIECGASDLIIKDTDYSDVTSFIAGVGDEYIFYEIEPEQFTLDSPLPTITTLLGNNNIWSDTGDVLECVYQRDLNIAINELFSRVAALEQASGTRSLSLSKSAVKEEETKEETKEEEQNEDKR